MTVQFKKDLIPHVGVIVLIASGLLLTRDWPYETALFPRFGCIMVLVAAIISFISELVKRRHREAGHSDAWVSSHLAEDHSLKRAPIVFGWLVLFLIGVWSIGYEFAAVAFVFLFMKMHGRQSWKMSIAFTGFSFLFLFSVFGLLLDIIWPHGVLWEIVGL